jgi:tetratricopeptide (TPR) repeat protein
MITRNLRAVLPGALLLAALALSGCGGGTAPADLIGDAQAALSKGDYANSLTLFERADELLRGAEADDATSKQRYRARLGIVEAKIRLRDGDGARQDFATLAADHKDQVDWKVYQKVGRDLAENGCAVQAVEVLNQAEKAFPDRKEAFGEIIADIQSNAVEGSAEYEKLKALGYVK